MLLSAWPLTGLPLLLASLPLRAREPLQWDEVKARIRASHPGVPQLSVAALQAWLRDGGRRRPLLLDARARDEYTVSHIEGAHHAPTLAEAQAVLARHAQDRQVVLYCSVGLRSSVLAERLLARLRRDRAAGEVLPEVFNLEGSLFEWANAGLPLTSAQGPATQVHPYDAHWGTLLKRERWSRLP